MNWCNDYRTDEHKGRESPALGFNLQFSNGPRGLHFGPLLSFVRNRNQTSSNFSPGRRVLDS